MPANSNKNKAQLFFLLVDAIKFLLCGAKKPTLNYLSIISIFIQEISKNRQWKSENSSRKLNALPVQREKTPSSYTTEGYDYIGKLILVSKTSFQLLISPK